MLGTLCYQGFSSFGETSTLGQKRYPLIKNNHNNIGAFMQFGLDGAVADSYHVLQGKITYHYTPA